MTGMRLNWLKESGGYGKEGPVEPKYHYLYEVGGILTGTL